ncbi:MAG: chlorite dismutase family protein [Thermoguttaceae bacterium]
MSTETHDPIDIREKGRGADGSPVTLDRRLFMQFLAFGDSTDSAPLIQALEKAKIPGALYEDVNDPRGVALLILSEDPGFFVTIIRQLLNRPPFSALTPKPEYTMLGRTYAQGYEPDLEDALFTRPRSRILDGELSWVIWYPLRRAGSFERLSADEQRIILLEHGGIGRAFGKAGLGHDIRLACYGLDKNDNDFVIGLLGPKLYPLSAIVQRMRKTKQTSLHIEQMGPFFVGKVAWQGR